MLSDGVFMGMDDVEGVTTTGGHEELVDDVSEYVTVVPAALGRLGLKFDYFNAASGHRRLIHRTAENGNLISTAGHLARHFEGITLHAADWPESARDVKDSQDRVDTLKIWRSAGIRRRVCSWRLGR